MILDIQAEVTAANAPAQQDIQYQFIQDSDLMYVGGGDGLMHF